MVGEPGLPTLSKGAVVFSQLSDGLLEAHPTPPERIVVRRHNAMGAHAPLARVELAGDEVPATVGELREKLYALFAISRRQRVDLFFWGKRLDDDATSLLDCRISTNSELTLATSARTRAELALLREASALRRVRICSNKVVSFTIGNVSRETTVAELRRAVHAHLHAPLSYLAIESWKPDADSLVFHRGDQLVKEGGGGGGKKAKGGVRMHNLHNRTVGGVAAPEQSLVECRVELADTALFYAGQAMADEQTLSELNVLHDDLVFLDIKRPPPFDPQPTAAPAKADKKAANGKGPKKT